MNKQTETPNKPFCFHHRCFDQRGGPSLPPPPEIRTWRRNVRPGWPLRFLTKLPSEDRDGRRVCGGRCRCRLSLPSSSHSPVVLIFNCKAWGLDLGPCACLASSLPLSYCPMHPPPPPQTPIPRPWPLIPSLSFSLDSLQRLAWPGACRLFNLLSLALCFQFQFTGKKKRKLCFKWKYPAQWELRVWASL